METMEIIEKKHNILFNREEIKLAVESDSSISFPQAYKIISEKFKAPEENIKVEGIQGKFGSKKFIISAKVYTSKQEKDRIEPKAKQPKKK